MSKQLFELMRMEELENEWPTKKSLQMQSSAMVAKVLEDGNHNPIELFAQAVRLNEALAVITDKLKQSLPNENFEAFGLKGVYAEGGDILNLTDDPIYSDLSEQLKERGELLKLAYKSKNEIYDSEGVEVPKVSSYPRKGSLRISF